MALQGSTLKAARLAANLTVSELARRTGLSKQHLSNVEMGTRPATDSVVAAYEQALGDTVRRRAVLTGLATAAAAGITLGPAEAADFIRQGFNGPDDIDNWPAVVKAFEAEFVHLPPDLGRTLLAHLMIVQHQINTARTDRPDLLAAGAAVAQLYGLWLGNANHLAQARGWYKTAADLADQAGDPVLQAHVRARTANRGPYERMTVRATLDTAGRALALHSGPSAGTVDAYGARVHIHALTDNLGAGRAAAAAMLEAADGMDGDAGAIAHARALLFRSYLESRVGDPRSARAAFDAADQELRPILPWHVEARVYLARNQARHGDPAGGVAEALRLVTGFRRDVRVLGIAVSDVLEALPPGYRTDDTDRLATFASPEPGPWVMLR